MKNLIPLSPNLYRSIAVWVFTFVLLLSYQPSEAQVVYVTKTGEKYHRSSCQYLRSSKIAMPLAQAQQYGYGACKVCKPPLEVDDEDAIESPRVGQPAIQESPPVQRATTVQCQALTQAGSRCKRMTTNASGRCWQHE